ncbi:MAG: ribonuclease HII [Patescibacteria group bacterium]
MRNGKAKWIIGIDEAGRGPLAGPVSVGAVLVPKNFKFAAKIDKKGWPMTARERGTALRDSKKLSAAQREAWAAYMARHSDINFAVSMVSAAVIDKVGIQKAVKMAVGRVLRKLKSIWLSDSQIEVLLDGLLHAPKYYRQRTIINGDNLVPVISAASVVAKVRRDRAMLRMHEKFPQYGFDLHKGYGTVLHYKCLRRHGLSEIHRKSYLRNL